MSLNEVKLNTICVVKTIVGTSEKTKIRLMELGLIEGIKVLVIKRSLLKKTLLITFENSCFTLNSNLASLIEVNYA